MEWIELSYLAQDSMIKDGLANLSMLPLWLLAACNPDRIRGVLSQIVPQFAKGQILLQGCEVDHIRYQNDHWTGFYHLITRLPGENTQQTVNLEGDIYPPGVIAQDNARLNGDFGTEGWQAVIPEFNLKFRTKESEKVLASLAYLTDPEQSRQYLTSSIRSGSPRYSDLEITASHPHIVRYKPGSRCTIVYQLEYMHPPDDRRWPSRVVAKTYRGVKGKNAFDSMTALWSSPLGSSGALNIAEPLAYDQQERVMIQAAIPEETTLKNLIRSALHTQTPEAIKTLNTILRKTAAGLAELHQCGVELGETWDWEDEIAEIQERVDRLSIAYPVVVSAVEPLLNRLKQLASEYPPDLAVPSHGSFRPSQVLIYQEQVGFIDFDAFCQSEPGNDLAQFLSTLVVNILTNQDVDEEQDKTSVTQEETQDEEVRAARFVLATTLSEKFLDAYEQHHPVSRQRVALWETLHILMLVLHYWIKVKPEELKEILYLLERFLIAKNFVGRG